MPDGATAAVTVKIGAVFESAFGTVFGRATERLNRIGSVIQGLRKDAAHFDELRVAEQRMGTSVERLTGQHEKASAAVQKTSARVDDLRAKMAAAGDPTGKLALRLDSAEQAAARAQTRFTAVDAELVKARGEYAAVAAEASRYAAANVTLGASLAQLDAAEKRSLAASQARTANLNARQRYHQSMIGMVAAGATIWASVRQAVETEEQRFPLRIGLAMRGMSEREIGDSIGEARGFARDHPVKIGAVLDTQLALTQRGMAPQVAREMSGFVSEVGSLIGQEANVTANTVGALYDALGNRMQGTAEQRVRHIGDVMTQAYYQFGMKLDGESMRKMTASASRLNIGLEDTVALLGTLKRAGFDEASASGAVEMMLSKLSIASRKYGFQMARNADGGLDWSRTLTDLRHQIYATAGPYGYGAIDQAMSEIAGPKGRATLTTLFQATSGANEFGQELAKLRNSGGFVDATAKKKMDEASEQLEKLHANFQSIGAVLGGTLIPGFNMILAPIGKVSAALSNFTDHHRILGRVIGTVAAAGITFAASVFGIGYAMTYIRAPFLAFRDWLRRTEVGAIRSTIALHALSAAEREAGAAGGVATETAVAEEAAGGAARIGLLTRIPLIGRLAAMFGLVSSAAPAAAAGEAAVGAAAVGGIGSVLTSIGSVIGGLLTGPVIAIGAAIVTVGALVWKYWKPIGAFFRGFGEGVSQAFEPVGRVISEAFAPLKPMFSWMGDALGTIGGWFGSLFHQSGLTAEGFKTAFASGIWWGQKIGAVFALVFTAVTELVNQTLRTLGMLGKVLFHLVTTGPGEAWKDVKDWAGSVANSAVNVGAAWTNIASSPYYGGVDKVAQEYQANQEAKGSAEKPKGGPIGSAMRKAALGAALATAPMAAATGQLTLGGPVPGAPGAPANLVALSRGAASTPVFPGRAASTPAKPAAQAQIGGDTYSLTVNINGAGLDTKQLSDLVRRQSEDVLTRAMRAADARRRGALHD
ncbi:MAG: phage tail tape measure protein [Terracidiphilus sp.]|nr:phage tail tape measure protein [Terracidiphilus sp.]